MLIQRFKWKWHS